MSNIIDIKNAILEDVESGDIGVHVESLIRELQRNYATGKEIKEAVFEQKRKTIQELASIIAKKVVAKAEQTKKTLEYANSEKTFDYLAFLFTAKTFSKFQKEEKADCQEIIERLKGTSYENIVEMAKEKKEPDFLQEKSYLDKTEELLDIKSEEKYKITTSLKSSGMDIDYEDIFYY